MAVPKLRFKEFDGEWEHNKLNRYLEENKQRNRNKFYAKEDVLSVSGEYGVVNQIELQGRSFAGESVELYHVVEKNDVVYTKSPLKTNPYGIIKHNANKTGIVSTLYAVYHPKNKTDSRFIEYYFDNDLRLNKYLKPLVNIGAKHDMKISNDKVISDFVYFPKVDEQQKIADFLTIFDKRIQSQQDIIADLEEAKKGLLQKIFSQEIRFKDENGQDYPDWEEKKLGDFVSYVTHSISKESNCFVGTENMYSNFGGVIPIEIVNTYKGYQFGPNDILLGNIRPYLKKIWLSDRDGICSTDLLLLRVCNILPSFLFAMLCTEEFFLYNMAGAKGTKMPRGDKKHILNWCISVPREFEEQEKISKFLSLYDNKITAEKQVLSDLQEIKRGLLQQMFV